MKNLLFTLAGIACLTLSGCVHDDKSSALQQTQGLLKGAERT
jgi:hypothetical protein